MRKITTIAFDVGQVLIDIGDFESQIAKWKEKHETAKSEEEWVEGYNIALKLFKPKKQVINLALKLKEKYQVGILSNVSEWGSHLPVNQEIYKKFKPLIVLSFQTGFSKPAPEIYKIFCQKAKSLPEEVLFIDDKEDNCAAARSLGLRAIRFTGYKELVKDLKKAKLLN